MSDIFKTKQNNQWVGIPALIGPEGQQGPQGETGQTGAAAGIGSVTATATSLPAGSSPTASATCSGPDTNKSFDFTFGLPTQAQSDWSQTQTDAVDYIKNKPDLSLKEDKSNKVTSISASSTNTQYPSAKCVYDAIQASGGTKYVEHAGWLTDRPLSLTSADFDLGVTHIYHVNITNSGDTGRTYTLFSVDSGDTSLWKVNDTFLERNSAYNYGYSYYLSVYVGNGGTHRNDYLITRVR